MGENLDDIDEVEMQARKLNEADRALTAGLRAYVELGYSEEEIELRVGELLEEANENV